MREVASMGANAWLAVKLYFQTEVLSGFIYHACEERLLDILSGVSVRRPESRGRFVELSEVTVQHSDGKEERLPGAYVNKATIQLAATLAADSGRGIGAKIGTKPYPFQQKSTVPVSLRTAAYAINGNMHRATYQRVWHVLEERPMFLPLTNVDIQALVNGSHWKVPFVAVNKEQILSLQEEGTPFLQVVHPQPQNPT